MFCAGAWARPGKSNVVGASMRLRLPPGIVPEAHAADGRAVARSVCLRVELRRPWGLHDRSGSKIQHMTDLGP